MIEDLANIFRGCVQQRQVDFGGLGVLVYTDISRLPIYGMRGASPNLDSFSTQKALAKVSSMQSEYHDGFHLLSTELRTTHFSQFFSPPIPQETRYPQSSEFGGRYYAALFGSAISEVVISGVVSKNLKMTIFSDGMDVLTERLI